MGKISFSRQQHNPKFPGLPFPQVREASIYYAVGCGTREFRGVIQMACSGAGEMDLIFVFF